MSNTTDVIGHRVARVRITGELLLSIIMEGEITSSLRRIRCTKGLPDDARIRGARFLPDINTVEILVSSKEFGVVAHDEDAPLINPEYASEK